jgi:hypothetical protein
MRGAGSSDAWLSDNRSTVERSSHETTMEMQLRGLRRVRRRVSSIADSILLVGAWFAV